MGGKASRIEIAGVIAAGKTTLANLLQKTGLVAVKESFRRNPFLSDFYKDPARTALETEFTFLLQHYHAQKMAASSKRMFCTDFSLLLDRAYASVTLGTADRQLFKRMLVRAERDLPRRYLFIHVVCAPEIALARIRRRGRREERGISLTYLQRIDRALKREVESLGRSVHVLTMDSVELDFARRKADRAEVVRRFAAAVSN